MSELYTSLITAKLDLNGGVLPAMTPVPENVQYLIDPAFTPGLGALEEHPEKGLRCPIRGCGAYKHNLTRHLNAVHREIGGAESVRRALQIPLSAGLLSSTTRAKYVRNASAAALNAMSAEERRERARHAARHIPRRSRSRSHRSSMGVLNLRNACEAQVAQRILCLRDKLGRVPSMHEADRLDPGLKRAALRLYGRWTAAVAACGLKSMLNGRGAGERGRDYALDMLQAWYDQHGSLPTEAQAKCPTRTPLIPSANTIRKYMGTSSWPEAMRRVAAVLNIKGGRYGIPQTRRAA